MRLVEFLGYTKTKTQSASIRVRFLSFGSSHFGSRHFSAWSVRFLLRPCQPECKAPQGMEHSAGARWLVASDSRTPTSFAEVAQRTPARVTWSSPSLEIGSRNASCGRVRPSVPRSNGSTQENPCASPSEACAGPHRPHKVFPRASPQAGCHITSRGGEKPERHWPQQNASWLSRKTEFSKGTTHSPC